MNASKFVIILAVVIAVILFFSFDLHRYLTLEALKSNRQTLLAFHESHRLATIAAFMVIYILQTVLSLPGAAVMSLAAGAVFGAIAGTCYAVIAASIGATLAFLATRYLLRDLVLQRFGPRLERVNLELELRGFNYLLFLRLVPLFPFFLINLAAGVTRLPLRTFFGATLLGIIPGGFVYVNAGASLASIDSLAGIATPRVVASLALLGCFAVLPVVYTKLTGRPPAKK